jgi:hypothetical protein
VRRAGRQVLGAKWGMSAYVFRHSLAADLKADGLKREQLAVVLSHSVSETSGLYGFCQGGRKGVRDLEATGSRQVKVNHQHGKAWQSVPESAPTLATVVEDFQLD